MKKIASIPDTLVNRISFYHLAVFVMALPFDRLYSELALISLCIHTCIHLRKNRVAGISWRSVTFLSTVYILTLLGTMYTSYTGEALYEWERQLALVLFPLVLLCNGLDLRKYFLPVLLAMAISCTLTILYLYLSAFDTINRLGLPVSAIFSQAFINHQFSAPIDMHATYFSMYIALSGVAAGYAITITGSKILRIVYGFMLIILLIGLIQLSSRAVLIASAVIANMVFPFLIFNGKARIKCIIVSMLLSITVLFIITQTDALQNRFITELKDELTKNNVFEPRVKRWEMAWELIKTSPVYGHGSGSEVALLKELYFDNKLYNSYLNDLNAHNQYLSMAIKTGFVGLGIFLLMLGYAFRVALRNKDVVFCGFLVIITAVFFSENVLDANKGIFFFACFFSAFYLRGGVKI